MAKYRIVQKDFSDGRKLFFVEYKNALLWVRASDEGSYGIKGHFMTDDFSVALQKLEEVKKANLEIGVVSSKVVYEEK